MININTKFITLIGSPLSQSFAARMQNAAYRAMGLNMRYFYTEADSAHLKEIIDGLRYMPSLAGAAVTKPNKVEVLRYLDWLDPLCERLGACNTIVKTPAGELAGYNTDGTGFYLSLTEEAGISLKGGTFFCIGAGGAGRAICSALALSGAKRIYLSSRTGESRKAVAEDINRSFAPVVEPVEYGDYTRLRDCHVLVNASGVGMGKTQGESPVPPELLDPALFCFDACYNPAKTRFLLDAEAVGCRTLNGLGMSLYQGAAQIELWTGRKAPLDVMRRELLAVISE